MFAWVWDRRLMFRTKRRGKREAGWGGAEKFALWDWLPLSLACLCIFYEHAALRVSLGCGSSRPCPLASFRWEAILLFAPRPGWGIAEAPGSGLVSLMFPMPWWNLFPPAYDLIPCLIEGPDALEVEIITFILVNEDRILSPPKPPQPLQVQQGLWGLIRAAEKSWGVFSLSYSFYLSCFGERSSSGPTGAPWISSFTELPPLCSGLS